MNIVKTIKRMEVEAMARKASAETDTESHIARAYTAGTLAVGKSGAENVDAGNTGNAGNTGSTSKRFSVIYADPPWDVANQRGGKSANLHYPLMTVDKIKNMPITAITTPSSVCFLWLSNGIYQEGIDVLHAWGYRPISDFIWIKPRIGLGQYFRYASEKMLMGVRGKMPPAIRTQPNWGFYPVQEHSHKPEEIYTVIERMYPNEQYLELFARRRPPNKDWYIWGNEAPGGSDIYIPGYPVPKYSNRASPPGKPALQRNKQVQVQTQTQEKLGGKTSEKEVNSS